MSAIVKKLGDIGIIPVVAIEDAADAAPLGEALLVGGLPCAEITFRTAAAEEAIRNISTAHEDILVGAGTVLTVEQAEKAAAAGARFIVTPGFDPQVQPSIGDFAECHAIDIVRLLSQAASTELFIKCPGGLVDLTCPQHQGMVVLSLGSSPDSSEPTGAQALVPVRRRMCMAESSSWYSGKAPRFFWPLGPTLWSYLLQR